MTIPVAGATGNIGGLVVNYLIRLGPNDIRALTTNPVKAVAFAVDDTLGKPYQQWQFRQFRGPRLLRRRRTDPVEHLYEYLKRVVASRKALEPLAFVR
jgi:hypothetical protein